MNAILTTFEKVHVTVAAVSSILVYVDVNTDVILKINVSQLMA